MLIVHITIALMRGRSYFYKAAYSLQVGLQDIIWACVYVWINVCTYLCACMCVAGNTLSHSWVERKGQFWILITSYLIIFYNINI